MPFSFTINSSPRGEQSRDRHSDDALCLYTSRGCVTVSRIKASAKCINVNMTPIRKKNTVLDVYNFYKDEKQFYLQVIHDFTN